MASVNPAFQLQAVIHCVAPGGLAETAEGRDPACRADSGR